MEARLNGRQWIMDDEYTIADISMLGWVRNLIGFYGARELVAFDDSAASRPGSIAAWRGPRCSGDWRFRSGRERRSLGHAGRLQRLGIGARQ